MDSRAFIFAFIAFLVLAPAAPAHGAESLTLAQSDTAEIAFWESVKDTSDPAELEAYLSAYPDGKFAPLAKIRLNKLKPREDTARPATESGSDAEGPSLAQVIEQISKQVVTIRTSLKTADRGIPDLPKDSPFKQFFEDFFNNQKPGDSGTTALTISSGFIYSRTGHVVTATHAVNKADKIEVTLADGQTIEADIIGKDPRTSIAVLKLRGHGPYTAVTFGDSDTLKVGEEIIVVGNSNGLAGTVKTGIVSGMHRDLNAGPYDDFIQTEQGLAPSYAGAAMFDHNGRVVGMVALKFKPKSGTGSDLTVPIGMVRRVADDLVAHGETRRGWLGVRIQQVTDEIAESLGLKDTTGALVASVTPGSPAAGGGLKAGDVIIRFGGKTIVRMRDLPRQVANTPIDSTIDVELWRDRQPITRKVTIGRLETAALNTPSEPASPPSPGQSADHRTIRALGMTLESVSPDLRAKFKIPANVTGAVVTLVESGGPAANKRIAAGDVVVEVDQAPAGSPAEVASGFEKLSREGRNSALLLVTRQADSRFVALPLAGLKIEYDTAAPSDNSTMMSVAQVQRRLTELGYNPGPVDGKFGEQTKTAIRQFQSAQTGMIADGLISNELSQALRTARRRGDSGASPAPAARSDGPGTGLENLDTLD